VEVRGRGLCALHGVAMHETGFLGGGGATGFGRGEVRGVVVVLWLGGAEVVGGDRA